MTEITHGNLYEIYLGGSVTIDGVTYSHVKDTIDQHRRWEVIHEVIFKNKAGRHYRAYLSVPATESQMGPEDDDVTLVTEVVPITTMTTIYVKPDELH